MDAAATITNMPHKRSIHFIFLYEVSANCMHSLRKKARKCGFWPAGVSFYTLFNMILTVIMPNPSCIVTQLSAEWKAALTSNYQQEGKLYSQAIISRKESCTHKQLLAGKKAALTSNYQQDGKLHSKAGRKAILTSRTESCTHTQDGKLHSNYYQKLLNMCN